MEDRLKEISRLRKKAHTTLVKKKSSVYEAFLEMEQTTSRDGACPIRPGGIGVAGPEQLSVYF